jgi:SAM-dependent methyltransferase
MRSFSVAFLLLLTAPTSQSFTAVKRGKPLTLSGNQKRDITSQRRRNLNSGHAVAAVVVNKNNNGRINKTLLHMGLDMVTYIRCEWVSAALCTNQTPRSANVCLQLGTEDGRPITFIPRTIETFLTSTVEADGILPVSVERQLKQQERTRGAAVVKIVNQRADDLKETADESVDVVISLQAAARMKEKGLDWKKSVQEAARVLKSGGRFLFVEQTNLEGENYLDYVGSVGIDPKQIVQSQEEEEESGDDDDVFPTFECIGYDDVDLVLVPHVAAVFVKSEDAGLSVIERAAKEAEAEKERMTELSISAFERGLKKRKRKKKKVTGSEVGNA